MEKVNLEEGNNALQRVLLMMKYDMNKTLNENKGIVSEQEVPKGYTNIIGASEKGFGTDENRLVAGFKELETAQDFFNLNNHYKSKWGKEIPYLLRKELGIGDAWVAKQIADHLKTLGFTMSYSLSANKEGVVSDTIKISYNKPQKPVKQETKPQPQKQKPTWVQGPKEEEVKAGKKLLKSGMMGDFVKKVQNQLKVKGVNPGTIDGKFGKNTKNAVIQFQKTLGLKPDGVVGKNTYDQLFFETPKVEPTNVQQQTPAEQPGLNPVYEPKAPEIQRQQPTIPPLTNREQRRANRMARRQQNAHVDPQPTIKESLKNTLKKTLVEKKEEKENLLIESKIINNRFNIITEGRTLETDEDQIRLVEDIIVEMNYMVNQGYTSQVINEGLFSMLGSLFGGSMKSVPAVFGEYIAKWLTKTLGVPEGSFIQGAIMALVGNLNIADYDKFFTDCRFASNKIADSLIEGYLIQMQQKAQSTSQGATGFITSALRNAVSEYFLEEKDGIVQKLQDMIGDFICPKLGKVSSVIADKAQDIKDKAVA